MGAPAPLAESSQGRRRSAARARAWFAGLGWQGIAIVVCIALINAMRRTVFNIAGNPDFRLVHFLDALGTGLLVGFAMLLAVVAALNRFPQRGRLQYLAIVAAILASGAISVLVKDVFEMASPFGLVPPPSLARYFVSDWLRYSLLGGLIAGAFLYLRAEAEIAAMAHRVTVDSERMARDVAEARLRMLEAQIEPHFLFNTLAAVKRLFRTDAREGERTLDNLMRYLRVALPQMRAPESTLGQEAALAASYLDIQRMRMGRRMKFTIDTPASLRDARLPPFTLLTLVENAIKHGLDPLPEGGVLRVTARAADGRLVVEVRDTGRGFAETSGAGTGLANISARLELLYGSDGSLAFARNEPHGVVATLALPLERSRGTASG